MRNNEYLKGLLYKTAAVGPSNGLNVSYCDLERSRILQHVDFIVETKILGNSGAGNLAVARHILNEIDYIKQYEFYMLKWSYYMDEIGCGTDTVSKSIIEFKHAAEPVYFDNQKKRYNRRNKRNMNHYE